MKKLLNIALGALALTFCANLYAQENDCVTNTSLFTEFAKSKQYADAAGPWLAVYTECPSSSKNIYKYGREILRWQLGQTLDAAKRAELRNRLMEMHDKRIQYFGNDAKYPEAYILGLKAQDYVEFFPEDELKENAYKWLKQSIETRGTESQLAVLPLFIQLSHGIYRARQQEHIEQFIADYMLVSGILDEIAHNPEDKNAQYAEQTKNYINTIFAQSGAADCATLDKIYQAQIASKSSDLEYLNSVIGFYELTDCTESEVYFAASEAAHKIAPTAKSASGCANMAIKRGDLELAVKYLEEAVERATEKTDKAKYELVMAQLLYKLHSFSAARTHARNSLQYVPNQSKPYQLIATMYAESKPFDDVVLNKTVYWVAVDQLQKAKQADPANAEEIQKAINTYSRYFPTTEEVFFQPDLGKGKSFYVGGWIGESTICR
ncbi:MAG: hypothetical protein IJU35_02760 [Paludibacteraceae bacterium]|nr:hypothetical protein [Paludibacteraceae bacterium]